MVRTMSIRLPPDTVVHIRQAVTDLAGPGSTVRLLGSRLQDTLCDKLLPAVPVLKDVLGRIQPVVVDAAKVPLQP